MFLLLVDSSERNIMGSDLNSGGEEMQYASGFV